MECVTSRDTNQAQERPCKNNNMCNLHQSPFILHPKSENVMQIYTVRYLDWGIKWRKPASFVLTGSVDRENLHCRGANFNEHTGFSLCSFLSVGYG